MKCQYRPGLLVATASVVAVLGWTSPVNAQQFVALPAGYTASDVTPDGKIVVGSNGIDSFVWRWKQDPSPTFITGGAARATSDDGSVLAGNRKDPITNQQTAAIWTQATGWQSLGALPGGSCGSMSSGYAISGDGTIVVGLGWNNCSGRGFRWTASTGMQELQNLVNGQNRCSAISRDGSTMGGFAQGNFERTPAFWNPNSTGFVLDANFQGEVHGFNNDGSRSVGTFYFGGSTLDAFVRDKQTGVMTNLGHLNPGWRGNATDISEDGNVIVGFDVSGLALEAWVWTSSDGIISLNSRLAALGVTGVPPLAACSAVSDAGNVIVGGGSFSTGFIVELPSLVPYGTGTPGCNGAANLSASPAPAVNTPTFTLTSTNVPPSALGLLLITNAADEIGSDPFSIGVLLHVDLFLSTETLAYDVFSDAFGVGPFLAPIPNVPALAGSTYYAQTLWAWSASTCFIPPYNLSTTNGLEIPINP